MNSTRTQETQASFTTPSVRADSIAGDSTERDSIQRKEIIFTEGNPMLARFLASDLSSRRKTVTCTTNLGLLALIPEVEAAWLG